MIKSFYLMLCLVIATVALTWISWGSATSTTSTVFIGVSFILFVLARMKEMEYWDVILINIGAIILIIAHGLHLTLGWF